MLFVNFYDHLQKLNPRIKIDCEHQVTPYHKDWPMAGLYVDNKYIMGVSHQEVPEFTLIAINGRKLRAAGYPVGDMIGKSNKFFDSDFIENIRKKDPDALDERVLAKGYRSILAELVKRKAIDKMQAEFLFGVTIEPNRPTFPKRYLDLTY
jgi:hypothetical protein